MGNWIGEDSSGQGNNYNIANIDWYDVTVDSPTNNFCTFNWNDAGDVSLSQGNCKVTTDDHSETHGTFKFPSTGKWYYEIYFNTVGAAYAGIAPVRYTLNAGTWDQKVLAIVANSGAKYSYYSGGWQNDSYGSAFSDGDILQCAVDMDNGKIWWGDSGTWIASGDPGAGSNQAFTFTVGLGWKPMFYGPGGGTAATAFINFGQRPTFNNSVTAGGNADGNGYGNFKYAVPSGFLSLCSANIPTPAVIKGTDHFNTVLWTGSDTSAGRSITGVGFQPDYVWSKSRSDAFYWNNFDAVRGVNNRMNSDNDNAEGTSDYGNLSAFDSDGFTTAAGDTNNENWNKTSSNYVAFCWKAGGSTSNNTAGDDNSVVSLNADAGFSIVTYTDGGVGTRTVGHGLGKKPDIVLQKGRGSSQPWYMYINNDDITSLIAVNLDVPNDWYTWNNGAAPTTTLFSQNYSGGNIVAYCWAAIEGYSQFGTYQGNNSTYGPFINTGFRPAFTLIKRTGTTGSWFMYDNKRDPFNPVDEGMFADGTWAESTQTNGMVDYLSNGFRIRNTGTSMNAASGAYFYWAFAESPFKYSNAK